MDLQDYGELAKFNGKQKLLVSCYLEFLFHLNEYGNSHCD
jgi:hypothetical protein